MSWSFKPLFSGPLPQICSAVTGNPINFLLDPLSRPLQRQVSFQHFSFFLSSATTKLMRFSEKSPEWQTSFYFALLLLLIFFPVQTSISLSLLWEKEGERGVAMRARLMRDRCFSFQWINCSNLDGRQGWRRYSKNISNKTLYPGCWAGQSTIKEKSIWQPWIMVHHHGYCLPKLTNCALPYNFCPTVWKIGLRDRNYYLLS